MKKLRCVLVLTVMLLAFAGCGKAEEHWTLEGQMKTEVEKAWEEQEIYGVGQEDPFKLVWVDVKDADSLRYRPRYYGTYGNAVVFLQPRHGGGGMSREIELAEQIFYSSNWFDIYVYRDGKFCLIDEAYEQGILTMENIKMIAEYHKWFELTYFKEFYENSYRGDWYASQ